MTKVFSCAVIVIGASAPLWSVSGITLAQGVRPAVTHIVKIETSRTSTFKFAPKTITIHAGQSIKWVNHTGTEHTATANNSSWTTPVINPKKSSSHKFKKTGTFKYHCNFHPFMKATVKVIK